jgi:hypothetical protein
VADVDAPRGYTPHVCLIEFNLTDGNLCCLVSSVVPLPAFFCDWFSLALASVRCTLWFVSC